MTEPATDYEAPVDRAYTDLLENGDEPELVAIRHGISLDELRGACAHSPEGHEMEGHDAGDGVWYRNYGRWCAVCGAPDEGDDDL
jgi:hypothetical protein